ncbi:MAG: hypothetical protein HYT70_02380 [Candidatus Aenigmarchaeota archaeon]|nr:hypothetical protein [Candidatus Aenigmarchaeota archaeon]
MSTETQIATCTEHYKSWREKALGLNDIQGVKKATERAFFWLELRSALMFLKMIEQTNADGETKKKLIIAKSNLSRKLSDYMKKILDEMEQQN